MNHESTQRGAPFTGIHGRVVARLLQFPFVRFHRVQLGFVQTPSEYERFLVEVVGPRLGALPDRLAIFGAGEHTRVLLKALPDLNARIHGLIDNNPALWRQKRFGHVVTPPDQAITEVQSIFLSTAVFQHVLRASVRRMGFKGPIYAVDDVVPANWFLAA